MSTALEKLFGEMVASAPPEETEHLARIAKIAVDARVIERREGIADVADRYAVGWILTTADHVVRQRDNVVYGQAD